MAGGVGVWPRENSRKGARAERGGTAPAGSCRAMARAKVRVRLRVRLEWWVGRPVGPCRACGGARRGSRPCARPQRTRQTACAGIFAPHRSSTCTGATGCSAPVVPRHAVYGATGARCGASHGTRYVRYRGWYTHGANTTLPPRGELPCASLLRHRARVTRVDIERRGLVLAVVAVLRGDVLHGGQALHPLLRVAVLLARRRKRRRVGVVVHGFRPSASLWPTCLAPRARRRARAL